MTKPANAPRVQRVTPPTWAHIAPFALIALGAFAAATGVLLLMLSSADTLVRLGLAGNLYYIVLVPLGLAVAALLFGVLKSYAVYSGTAAGGTLELGGPIVGFLLVLVLGFWLVPNPSSFATTIFVHGDGGKDDLPLRNRGTVWLDLGGDRRRGAIGDQGQAYFAGIPATFRGQTVGVGIDADGYEPAAADRTVKLDGDGVYFPVRHRAVVLTGYVKAAGDGRPIERATVSVAGRSAETDRFGFFRLALPGEAIRESATMQATAAGFAPWQSEVVARGNEITVLLERAR